MMKKHSVAILSILLAAMFAISLLSSCATPGGTDSKTDEVSGAAGSSADITTASLYDAEGYLLDDLPADLKFGDTLSILRWEDVEHPEFDVEEQTGDLILDQLFSRNQTVETRLGLTIEWHAIKGNSDNRSNWNNHLINKAKSGDADYDVLASYSLSIAMNASSGLLTDMLDTSTCPYLNFSQPWWSDLLIEQATILGKLYFASGDISRNALEMMYVCFVNNELLSKYNLENPQKYVESGDWTYDKFIEMCQGVYEGAGTKDPDADTFGYMCSGIHNDPWFYGSGATICEKDENGYIVSSESMFGERVVDTLDKMIGLFGSQYGIYTDSVKHQKAFRDNRILFCTDRCRCSHKVFAENADCKYVVVPCPKYNKDQDRFYTVMGNPFTLYAIAANCEDKAKASAFVECMASEGYRKVTPAVFELSLKTKYVDDPTSGEMYDIIRESLTYDLGRIFSNDLIGQGDFRSAISMATNSWMTRKAGIEKRLDTLTKKLMQSFESLG